MVVFDAAITVALRRDPAAMNHSSKSITPGAGLWLNMARSGYLLKTEKAARPGFAKAKVKIGCRSIVGLNHGYHGPLRQVRAKDPRSRCCLFYCKRVGR